MRQTVRGRHGRAAGTLVVPVGIACALAVAAALAWGRTPATSDPAAAAAPAERPGGRDAGAAGHAPARSARASASSVPLAISDDLDPRVERRRGPHGGPGEREHHEALVRLGRQDPAALEARARQVLAGGGPRSEQVAALRALLDVGCPERAELLASAATGLPHDSGGPTSVAWMAVELLRRHAGDDGEAREALQRVVASGAAGELRRNAAAALAAHGTRGDLHRLERALDLEPAPEVRAAALASLPAHPDRELAGWFALRWGGEYPLREALPPAEE